MQETSTAGRRAKTLGPRVETPAGVCWLEPPYPVWAILLHTVFVVGPFVLVDLATFHKHGDVTGLWVTGLTLPLALLAIRWLWRNVTRPLWELRIAAQGVSWGPQSGPGAWNHIGGAELDTIYWYEEPGEVGPLPYLFLMTKDHEFGELACWTFCENAKQICHDIMALHPHVKLRRDDPRWGDHRRGQFARP